MIPCSAWRSGVLLILLATLAGCVASRPRHTALGDHAHELRIGATHLVFQAEPGSLPRTNIPAIYRRGGYISRVFSPTGLLLTDDFPTNHTHHHGVWAAWTKTRFEGRTPDFWNMGQGKGRVQFVALDEIKPSRDAFHVRARTDYVDMLARPEKTALHETWHLRAFDSGQRDVGAFDVELHQHCATDAPLELPQHLYGGFGFRGHAAWNGPTNLLLLTSDGETNRVRAHGTRVRWCWLGGLVEGRVTGIVLMGHPTNFRAPQPIRMHPEEPFFCFAPSQAGDFAIRPGETHTARFRMLTLDGPPERERIEAHWRRFADE
jgi:hypothetical protein